jgi:hypothetical protein
MAAVSRAPTMAWTVKAEGLGLGGIDMPVELGGTPPGAFATPPSRTVLRCSERTQRRRQGVLSTKNARWKLISLFPDEQPTLLPSKPAIKLSGQQQDTLHLTRLHPPLHPSSLLSPPRNPLPASPLPSMPPLPPSPLASTPFKTSLAT